MDEAVILAGGLGTRLRAAVPDVPKPMAPVAGRPFLEHLLDYWVTQGVRRFVLSLGYRHETLQQHFGSRYGDAEVLYAVETRPAGTGGGLLLAGRQIRGDSFIVLNGDTLGAVKLDAVRSAHAHRAADLTICTRRRSDAGRYTVVETDERGMITGWDVATDGARPASVNAGVYLFATHCLARLQSFDRQACSLERDLVPSLLASGARLAAWEIEGDFLDIGVPEDYLRAGNFIVNFREQ
jgi:D-glycero-alpha-D-manno-heptose 1-phosphate guanylyltransferase